MIAKQLFSRATKFFLALLLLLSVGAVSHAQTNDLKLELQLIWGTNDQTSPDPKHKPIEAALSKKFENSQFKWKNYFEVNRQTISVPANKVVSSEISPKCTVSVKNLNDGRISVKLIGMGKEVVKNTYPLSNGLLVIGGDAQGKTAWFVAVKEIK